MRLQHGTTLERAQTIQQNGPDPNFLEPGGTEPANGLSTARAQGPFRLGSPEKYARLKSNNFPNEGGPVILELELTEELAAELIGRAGHDVPGKAMDLVDEILFAPGYGLDELLAVWDQIPKRIIPLV